MEPKQNEQKSFCIDICTIFVKELSELVEANNLIQI